MITNIRQRLIKDKLLLLFICIFAALTSIPLFAIIGEVLFRGYDQLTWSFFTEPTPTAYKVMKAMQEGDAIPGGIANGIIGTMIMLFFSTIFAVPIGILSGAYLAENSKNRFAQLISYLITSLNLFSIVLGLSFCTNIPFKKYKQGKNRPSFTPLCNIFLNVVTGSL